MTIKRKEIKPQRLTDTEKIAKDSPIHDINRVEHEPYERKPKDSTMIKVWKTVKRFGGLIGGAITGGGSLLAGFDVTSALLIAGCTIALIVGVEVATIKEFKQLFEDD